MTLQKQIRHQIRPYALGGLHRASHWARRLPLEVGLPLLLLLVSKWCPLPVFHEVIGLYCVFIMPGWIISRSFFPWLRLTEHFVLAAFLSTILVPLPLYILQLRGGGLNETLALGVFVSEIGIVTVLSLLVSFVTFQEQKIERVFSKEYLPLALAVTLFVGLMAFLLSTYPFLPEADPYGFFRVVDAFIETGIHPQLSYRPFFALFVAQIHFVTGLPLWDIFKYTLPFLPLFLIIVLWDYTRFHGGGKVAQTLYPLVIASVPMFFLEAEIVRPQIFVMTFIPVVLYFLWRSVRTSSFLLWGSLFVCSVFSVKYHEMGLFMFAAAGITLLVIRPLRIQSIQFFHVLIAGGIVLLVANDVSRFITATLQTSADFIGAFLKTPVFRLWFLNRLINIDGTSVSWTGWGVAQYYGYILGVAVPFLAVAGILNNKIKIIFRREYVPMWLIFGLFFTLAEIFPRMSLNFLPDRAWLFAVISGTFLLIPLVIGRFEESKLFWCGVLFALSVSFGGGYYVALHKQGYVTLPEYEAAQFLRTSTSSDSIIVTQGGNTVAVEFFGKRKIKTYRPIFFQDTVDSSDLQDMQSEFMRIQRVESVAQATIEREQKAPHYLMYSFDKFKNLYDQRQWWREGNYYGANIESLRRSDNLKLVFDNGSVLIWKVVNEKE